MLLSPNRGPHGKLYDMTAAAALTGYTRANVHLAIKHNRFPAPAVVFNHTKGYDLGRLWHEEDLLAWANLSMVQKRQGKGARLSGMPRIEDHATGKHSGLIVCTISGDADGFLSAVKSVEYSFGGLTREEAAEVALKAAQEAYRGEA
ncbi:helix-turn-helix transcriptional regulator [Rothia mucilaginosa]|uniref:helix-turn-helix transcriptional regulator n=1 Tax=Rothia mucilaginosa TaxID=43675 RepID=UPI0026194023|nr:hypothetical protein [uncultured Rothia sp.]